MPEHTCIRDGCDWDASWHKDRELCERHALEEWSAERTGVAQMKEKPDTHASWCTRCGEDWEDHATMMYDEEQHWICPRDERAVIDKQPQQQLAAFEQESDT